MEQFKFKLGSLIDLDCTNPRLRTLIFFLTIIFGLLAFVIILLVYFPTASITTAILGAIKQMINGRILK